MGKSVAEILAGVDLFAEDQRDNLLDALAVARRDCPVLRTDSDGGYYVVSRYEDVRAVCERPELFSSAQPGLRGVRVRLIPLDVDPPGHRLFRTFLNGYFSRSFLLRYEEQIRRIAREVMAGFVDKGELDVVRDYAVPFSAGSLARIVFATDNQDLVDRAVAAVNRCAVESTPDTFEAVALLALEAMAEVRRSDRVEQRLRHGFRIGQQGHVTAGDQDGLDAEACELHLLRCARHEAALDRLERQRDGVVRPSGYPLPDLVPIGWGRPYAHGPSISGYPSLTGSRSRLVTFRDHE